MLKNLWKGKDRRMSETLEIGGRALLYRALFEFLIGSISSPSNAAQLIELGTRSNGMDADEVLNTYLLFEKYMTTFEQAEKHTRKSLRERVRQRFPALLQESIFDILFVPETVQKNTL